MDSELRMSDIHSHTHKDPHTHIHIQTQATISIEIWLKCRIFLQKPTADCDRNIKMVPSQHKCRKSPQLWVMCHLRCNQYLNDVIQINSARRVFCQLSTITTDNNQIDTKITPLRKHTYIGCCPKKCLEDSHFQPKVMQVHICG